MVFCVNPNPIHKRIHEDIFDCLVQLLNIIKSPLVPFLPKNPKQEKGAILKVFFHFFPRKELCKPKRFLLIEECIT